jgi:hypothetical protein
MASTKEYLDFVLEQLSELDEVSFRAMMGEYILYYQCKTDRPDRRGLRASVRGRYR